MICEGKYLKESWWLWRREETCVPASGFLVGASKTMLGMFLQEGASKNSRACF